MKKNILKILFTSIFTFPAICTANWLTNEGFYSTNPQQYLVGTIKQTLLLQTSVSSYFVCSSTNELGSCTNWTEKKQFGIHANFQVTDTGHLAENKFHTLTYREGNLHDSSGDGVLDKNDVLIFKVNYVQYPQPEVRKIEYQLSWINGLLHCKTLYFDETGTTVIFQDEEVLEKNQP